MSQKIRKVPPKDAFRDAILMNNQTYIDYLERMKKICLSMFDWQNLPDSMSSRFLEMCLFYQGQAAMLYDEDYGYINTMASDGGYINIYTVYQQKFVVILIGLIREEHFTLQIQVKKEAKNVFW